MLFGQLQGPATQANGLVLAAAPPRQPTQVSRGRLPGVLKVVHEDQHRVVFGQAAQEGPDRLEGAPPLISMLPRPGGGGPRMAATSGSSPAAAAACSPSIWRSMSRTPATTGAIASTIGWRNNDRSVS